MAKYRLSNHVSINDIDNSYEDIPGKYLNGYFIMCDKNYDAEYLINDTIKYYVEKFSICKTEEEVLKEIETDLQSTGKEIKETCSRFFKFLCNSKILVPDDTIENSITEAPLYKKGDTIGNLCICDILSGRRYIDVYSATDTLNDCVYVIKLLNKQKVTDATRFQKELTEMKQEYKMLQKVNHIPAINKAYELREDETQAFIVLEYIDGKSLSKYMREEAAITNSDCLHIIKGIISAFNCLHENNIVHGDIHSSNILITKDKDVKIIDLGMSNNVEIEENEIVKSGGVYFYMPPERINIPSFTKFSKAHDLLSDVYQVGLLLYLVLYNTLPFEGFTWEELAQNIKEGNISYPGLSFLNYPVPFEMIDIIKRCLNKEPLKRYRNASAILEDFRKHTLTQKQPAEI